MIQRHQDKIGNDLDNKICNIIIIRANKRQGFFEVNLNQKIIATANIAHQF